MSVLLERMASRHFHLLLAIAFIFGGTAPRAEAAARRPRAVARNAINTNPYYHVGRLRFRQGNGTYIGSGAAIGPKGVLTCSHVLWDPATGWSSNMVFDLGLYGSSYLARTSARKLYVYAGYQQSVVQFGSNSRQAFSRDLGGVRFRSSPGRGGYAGYWPKQRLLTGPTYNIALGYGAETYSGDYMLQAVPTRGYVNFTSTYLFNYTYLQEGGMSGGPVFAYVKEKWYIAGVIVSGSSAGAGVRALDDDAGKFIRRYLR